MCIVCALWQNEKLTRSEARQATREMVLTDSIDLKHSNEVYEMLREPDEPEHDEAVSRFIYEGGKY